MEIEIIELSNGKLVANFSSPHEFVFVDGSVLDAVDEQRAEDLKVTFIEEIDDDGDVSLSFLLMQPVLNAIDTFQKLWEEGEVDVVFCPLPMLTALKAMDYNIKESPFRTVRIEDRINKVVSIEKQCLL